jgi:hypothetical protein
VVPFGLVVGFTAGCYEYKPVTGTPDPSAILSFRLNDTGRAALEKNLGPAVDKVEGTVASSNDSSIALSVRAVSYFNGQKSEWTGERVDIARRFISDQRERRFSKSRTTLAALVGVAGIGAFIITRSILGSGSPDPDGGNNGGGTTDFGPRLCVGQQC